MVPNGMRAAMHDLRSKITGYRQPRPYPGKYYPRLNQGHEAGQGAGATL